MPADRKSPSKARKPPASPRKKPETLEVSLPTPPVLYSTPVANTLFYSILIKTLSHALAKNIDWHQMSKNIASEMEELDISTTSKSKAKGKGKAKQTDEPDGGEMEKKQQQKKGELTGLELHDHFHHTIYPALKAGVPIWLSKVEPMTISPATSVGSNDDVEEPMEEEGGELEDKE